jgi:zinc transport system substrate-binding protein
MKILAALVLAAPLALSGCTSTSAAARHTIYASLYPLQFIAQQIAGDHYLVVNLTKPGREPHDTELSLKQTAELSEAALVVYEKGLAAQVDDAVGTAEPKHVVDAAASTHPTADDPHVWLNPLNMVRIADDVEHSLAEIDPAHAHDYAANLTRFTGVMQDLDRDYTAGLEHCAITTVVVSHDAFRQLAKYGVETVAINGLSPEAEPSPAHIAQLRDLIEQDHITTVFNEELASAKMADVLARDLGLHTAVLDPIEGLSDQTKDDTYVTLMRKNLATLRKADDCS